MEVGAKRVLLIMQNGKIGIGDCVIAHTCVI